MTSQSFSYRWNMQLMAANGYVVIIPCRRGMPGFGTAWNEQISGDWGGQAMNDLLSAVDDYWRNCLLTFTTGALANQVRKVVDFDGTTKTVTVDTAFTDAPADGDRFILVNI